MARRGRPTLACCSAPGGHAGDALRTEQAVTFLSGVSGVAGYARTSPGAGSGGHGFPRLSTDSTGSHGFPRVPKVSHGFPRFPTGSQGFPRVPGLDALDAFGAFKPGPCRAARTDGGARRASHLSAPRGPLARRDPESSRPHRCGALCPWSVVGTVHAGGLTAPIGVRSGGETRNPDCKLRCCAQLNLCSR
jgi:hypothetical protein